LINKIFKIIEAGYCKLFAQSKRLPRLRYLKGNILLSLILALLTDLFKIISPLLANKTLTSVLFMLIFILLIYYYARASIARLHDIGLSAWYFFAAMLIYNIVALKFKLIATTFIMCFPGSSKNNKYDRIKQKTDDVFIA
jgi:uncharacterized membrane protein YhaH (DUF805 family)